MGGWVVSLGVLRCMEENSTIPQFVGEQLAVESIMIIICLSVCLSVSIIVVSLRLSLRVCLSLGDSTPAV